MASNQNPAGELGMHPRNRLELNVLNHFPLDCERADIRFLGNFGGYSGALLWKIDCPETGKSYCQRRWPMGTSIDQVRLIHQVLFHARQNGFPGEVLPLPLSTHRGQYVVSSRNDEFYELTPWLDGEADFHENPSVERVEKAAKILAQFHQASRPFRTQSVESKSLPGIQKRISFINELNQGLRERIQSQVPEGGFARFHGLILECYQQLWPRFLNDLQRSATYHFPQQICIKDIWHDHLLWRGDQVSGIVDFGTFGFDNVATDISRLFGSLFQNDRKQWEIGLRAYQSVRELSALELELIEVYDRSTTMLAGMNWLKWILIENRKFEEHLPIIERMEKLTSRLREWI